MRVARHAECIDVSTRLDCLNRVVHGSQLVPDCFDDDIRLQVARRLGPVVAGIVDDGVDAEGCAELAAVDDIDTDDLSCSARLDDMAEQHAYGTLANDGDALTGEVADLVHGIYDASQRL